MPDLAPADQQASGGGVIDYSDILIQLLGQVPPLPAASDARCMLSVLQPVRRTVVGASGRPVPGRCVKLPPSLTVPALAPGGGMRSGPGSCASA